MIGQILAYFAALAGIASAILWWKAATVVVHEGDPNSTGAYIVNNVDVQSTLNEQRKRNVRAAFASAVAMALSGVAPIFIGVALIAAWFSGARPGRSVREPNLVRRN